MRRIARARQAGCVSKESRGPPRQPAGNAPEVRAGAELHDDRRALADGPAGRSSDGLRRQRPAYRLAAAATPSVSSGGLVSALRCNAQEQPLRAGRR